MADNRDVLASLVLPQAQKYWEALGRFISTFSILEANIQNALWHFTGVSSVVAKSVFSGVRGKEAVSYIKRIAEAQDWAQADKDKWAMIDSRFGIINTVRNDIVHTGADFTQDEGYRFSNKNKIHTPKALREYSASPSVLDDLTQDTLMLSSHIVFYTWGRKMPPHIVSGFERTLSTAWLYTPPQPKNPQGKIRQKKSTRSRPPRS